ncbi:MAG: hypothetical protein ACRDZW_02490, partial [Acidimicrobiales bacterium]
FDPATDDGRRGRLATLLNKGQAHAALATAEGLEAALVDYEEAEAELDRDEAPYHFGLLQHSLGVALSALSALRPDERHRLLEEAVTAFNESLTVFGRTSFPYQHALAKHNLGLTFAGLAGEANLRRAMACFEDSVALFDTRIHAENWKQAFASLNRVEEELKEIRPDASRADHFASTLVDADDEDRYGLLRERLYRLLALPEPRRRSALAELGLAVAKLDREKSEQIMVDELKIVIEMPTALQEPVLRARFDAHGQLEGEPRLEADRALEAAVGAALEGPQRILVRDFFYSLGWERP